MLWSYERRERPALSNQPLFPSTLQRLGVAMNQQSTSKLLHAGPAARLGHDTRQLVMRRPTTRNRQHFPALQLSQWNGRLGSPCNRGDHIFPVLREDRKSRLTPQHGDSNKCNAGGSLHSLLSPLFLLPTCRFAKNPRGASEGSHV